MYTSGRAVIFYKYPWFLPRDCARDPPAAPAGKARQEGGSQSIIFVLFFRTENRGSIRLFLLEHEFDDLDDLVNADLTVYAGVVVFVVAELIACEMVVIIPALFILALDEVGVLREVVLVNLEGAFCAGFLRSIDEEAPQVFAVPQDIVAAASDDDTAALVSDIVQDLSPGTEDPVRDRNNAPCGPIKLSMAFFTELEQKVLKICMETTNSQSNHEKEKQSWRNQAP